MSAVLLLLQGASGLLCVCACFVCVLAQTVKHGRASCCAVVVTLLLSNTVVMITMVKLSAVQKTVAVVRALPSHILALSCRGLAAIHDNFRLLLDHVMTVCCTQSCRTHDTCYVLLRCDCIAV
jgi:hypothetical protein